MHCMRSCALRAGTSPVVGRSRELHAGELFSATELSDRRTCRNAHDGSGREKHRYRLPELGCCAKFAGLSGALILLRWEVTFGG